MHNLIMIIAVALLPCDAVAQSPASQTARGVKAGVSQRTMDLEHGSDHRLEIRLVAGESVIFWDRTGQPTEFKQSGRVSIRPGVYAIQVGDRFTTCRIWAHGTAPPTVVKRLPIVRGQSPNDLLWQLDSLAPRAMIVTGIGLGVWAALDSAS